MIARAIKLRFRRHLRIQKRQVEELGVQAEEHLESNVFKRLEHLIAVKRFVAAWVLFLVILCGCVVGQMRALGGYYQDISPAPGGTYTEGILSSYTNVNPIYARGLTDTSVSRLLFSSLMKYDSKNNLVGDLAESLTVNDSENVYTVKLRPNVKWHDGKPLTAEDVAFTYRVIQHPDARSPLASSWQGIAVEASNPTTVTFTLPGALSAFPQSLTNGIVPKHLLSGIPMTALRTAPFNTTKPVGSGPFMFNTLEVVGGSAENREERVALLPFEGYYAGTPKLDSFVVRTFRNRDRLVKSFNDREINAIVGLTRMPEELKQNENIREYSFSMTAQVMSFFNNSSLVLGDKAVRQALVQATDQAAIMKSLGYPTRPVTQPFLMGQLGYNPAYAQSSFNLQAARAGLDAAGWVPGKDGVRAKAGVRLSFELVAQSSDEYSAVAKMLIKQWREIGADVSLKASESDEFQYAVANHSYEALLYGISIGIDPDVFVYWDSKQASSTNFSEYKSPAADASLEAGRTRSDQALRKIKYEPFSKAWQADAPAVGLYQPRFYYVTRGAVDGLDETVINSDTDRYKNVHNWMIRTVRTSQQ